MYGIIYKHKAMQETPYAIISGTDWLKCKITSTQKYSSVNNRSHENIISIITELVA